MCARRVRLAQSAYPSRVIKGMRSSGHMGDVRVTIKRLTVARVDAENNLLMIRGAVPGANGSVVVVKRRRAKGRSSLTNASSFSETEICYANNQSSRPGQQGGWRD